MAELSISKAWEQTKEVIARDGRLIASVALALVLLPETIAGLVAPPPALSGAQPPQWTSIVMILVALAGITGQIAIIRLALGPATSVGEAIRHGLRRLLPAFGALLLFAIPLVILFTIILLAIGGPSVIENLKSPTPNPALAGAILLFVLIAFAISVRFQLMIPVAAAENAGPIAILKRSWEITAGHYLRLLAFLMLVALTAIVVLLVAQFTGGIVAKAFFGNVDAFSLSALVVALTGAIVQTGFTIVFSTMLARIYAQLAGRTNVAEVFR